MSSQETIGPDRDAIRAILMDRAIARAAFYKRHFRPIALQSLEAMVSTAANEVHRPNIFRSRSELWSTSSTAERLAEGVSAVERLVDQMAVAASETPGYPSDALGERTLTAAMAAGFCPCWPFC